MTARKPKPTEQPSSIAEHQAAASAADITLDVADEQPEEELEEVVVVEDDDEPITDEQPAEGWKDAPTIAVPDPQEVEDGRALLGEELDSEFNHGDEVLDGELGYLVEACPAGAHMKGKQLECRLERDHDGQHHDTEHDIAWRRRSGDPR